MNETSQGLDHFQHEVLSIPMEYTLLCCFAPEHDTAVNGARLRKALVNTGFRPITARHLVRTSPMLTRVGRDSYRLHRLAR